QAQPLSLKLRVLGDVGDNHWTIGSQHQLEDRAAAGQFVHRLTPIRLEPDAFGVGKAKQNVFSLEVFGSQSGDGIVARLWWRIQNASRAQRSEAFLFPLLIHVTDFQNRMRHADPESD